VTLSEAIDFVSRLRHGDRVILHRDGQQHEMSVFGRPSFADPQGGEPSSIGVTLTLGPGMWSTRVEAVNLAPLTHGVHKGGGGGTVLTLV
jgi:hypothetical protein